MFLFSSVYLLFFVYHCHFHWTTNKIKSSSWSIQRQGKKHRLHNDSIRSISFSFNRHYLSKRRNEFIVGIRSWFRRFCCDLATVNSNDQHQWRQVEADSNFFSFGISSCYSNPMMPNKNVHVFNDWFLHLERCVCFFLLFQINFLFVIRSDVFNSLSLSF